MCPCPPTINFGLKQPQTHLLLNSIIWWRKKKLAPSRTLKKTMTHQGLEEKKLALPGLEKTKLVLTQTSCSPLKSNGASLKKTYISIIIPEIILILYISSWRRRRPTCFNHRLSVFQTNFSLESNRLIMKW